MQADLGSGRTTWCAMAMIMSVKPSVQKTQAICITPTRELALHITNITHKLVHTATEILGLTLVCTEASHPTDSRCLCAFIWNK